MKKSFSITLVLSLLFLLTQSANAQIERGSYFLTLNAGYVPLTSQLTNNSIDGWTGSTTLEKLVGKSNWSIGMNFAFFNAEDSEMLINDVSMKQSYSSYSVYLGTKYFVTGLDEWVPYFGLSLGVHQISRYTSLSGTVAAPASGAYTGTELTSSYAFAAPVGINWFVSDDVYLGLNLTSVWMNDTYFTSDVNLLMNLSVGFQIN